MRILWPPIRAGFTLVELMVVVVLISMMAMVAAPRLLPILTLTEHENEARHLVGYGRAAMAHAVLKREAIVVHIDLDRQEYWTTLAMRSAESSDLSTRTSVNLSSYGRRLNDDLDEFDTLEDDDEWMPDNKEDLARAASEINHAARQKELGDRIEQEPEFTKEDDQKKILERQQDDMEESFAIMNQNTLFARAKRIKHDHESFRNEDNEPLAVRLRREEREREEAEALEEQGEAQPLNDPLLQRHVLIETVEIIAVYLGDEKFERKENAKDGNIIEIELSPLGLDMTVALEVLNEEDELLQVIWDPMTGNAWFRQPEEEG